VLLQRSTAAVRRHEGACRTWENTAGKDEESFLETCCLENMVVIIAMVVVNNRLL
jgi:hypothetical protein